jgi:hypothetical protein
MGLLFEMVHSKPGASVRVQALEKAGSRRARLSGLAGGKPVRYGYQYRNPI